MTYNNILFLIPARGGSKGLPGKNIKPLEGIPLIGHTINFLKECSVPLSEVYVSSDSKEILSVANEFGIDNLIKRPKELATDRSGMSEVIQHAIQFVELKGKNVDWICLLQPTSPIRFKKDLTRLLNNLEDNPEMIISTHRSRCNPYFNLYQVSESGLLKKVIENDNVTRQETPQVYEANGVYYLINRSILHEKKFKEIKEFKNLIIDEEFAVDIDDINDFEKACTIYKSLR